MTTPNDELTRSLLKHIEGLEAKVDAAQTAVQAAQNSIQTLKALVTGLMLADPLTGIDPRDPRNKLADKKLSDRGIEVCYRLFDAGKTRYAVAELMDISFSAANYRYDIWTHAGGSNRTCGTLD